MWFAAGFVCCLVITITAWAVCEVRGVEHWNK